MLREQIKHASNRVRYPAKHDRVGKVVTESYRRMLKYMSSEP